jgi:simple sugar transport system permease protein
MPVGLCLLIALALLWTLGYPPGPVLQVIWSKMFRRSGALGEILQYATPILLTGLAVTVAFRAAVWNIGAQGQFLAGALAAVAMGSVAPGSRMLGVGMVLIASVVAGGLVAVIAAVLHWWRRVPVVLSTLLLNFIVILLLRYLVNGPLADADPARRGQSVEIAESAALPLLDGRGLHLGFAVAIVMAAMVWFVLRWTTFGFRLRIVGQNATAGRFAGIHVPRVSLATLALSGALAGLGGGIEVAGVRHAIYLSDADSGFGFTGIAVALLGGLNPAGVVAAAIFFGALRGSFLALESELGVASVTGTALQGLVVILVLVMVARSGRVKP